MRIFWYSLGGWFLPSDPELEVVELTASIRDAELRDLSAEPYWYFFEPTPYHVVNRYDPIEMAERIANFGRTPPQRVVAFASHPGPVAFETQCAFAVQAGYLLGVQPEIQRVSVTMRGSRKGMSPKKSENPGDRTEPIDPGPEVDWVRALDAAVRAADAPEQVDSQTQVFAARYLRHSKPWFSPTQRRLLHRASTGELAVIAEDVAVDLSIERDTARKAIHGIARGFFQDGDRRRAPEQVGRLVALYSPFLRYNES